ncbi:MAG: restriction endonuclease subunit S [Oscillospiraceae bacterium]|nr:restriction endonuclease subunit S [Oscillospiraceae bacterium]
MLNLKLGEVASVRSGLVLSRKLSKTPTEYRYQLINLRSINPDGYIEKELVDVYDAVEPLSQEYLTRKGDVVLRLTAPYTAVLIDDSVSGMVVSSNFVVIRSDARVLLPEYLYWLLNTVEVNRQIYENTTSNMLSAINPRFFADLEVSLLPTESQEKIGALNILAHKECRLLKELSVKKEKYYAYTISEIQKQIRRDISYDNKK